MKYLIDISHIINWKGNLTGIERVEYHLIDYYYKQENSEFFYWDSNRFVGANREIVNDMIINRSSSITGSHSRQNMKKKAFARIRDRQNKTDFFKGKSGLKIIVLAGLWDDQQYISELREVAIRNSLIHVVYDMIPLVQKGSVMDFLPLVFENYFKKILPVSSCVMAISKSTATDTKEYLRTSGLDIPKIFSFRLGDDLTKKTNKVIPELDGKDFILSVGTIEARKNHRILYYAYKKLLEEGLKPPILILAGKRGWLTEDLQYQIEKDENLSKYVLIMDTVSDAQLSWLYHKCLFTIFPSVYEGWGLPIGESLAHGKVTLSSDTSSMPEVGGECADYFSPYSSDEVVALIKKYNDKTTLKKREEFIKKNFRLVSWQVAAQDFDKVVGSI